MAQAKGSGYIFRCLTEIVEEHSDRYGPGLPQSREEGWQASRWLLGRIENLRGDLIAAEQERADG